MTKGMMTPLLALVGLCFTAGTASAQPVCAISVKPGAAGSAVLNCTLVWSGCPTSAMAAVIEIWDGNNYVTGASKSTAGASGSFLFNPGANQGLVSGRTYTVLGYVTGSMGQILCQDTQTAKAP